MENSRVGIGRAVIVTLGGISLMWLTVAVTAAMTLAVKQPRAVLALWPSADARSVMAWTLITQSPTPQQKGEGMVLATAALAREPVSASAASAIGMIASLRGKDLQAGSAFAYSEWLSRRNLQAQLWFIQQSVQHGDVAGALHHYDIALRTEPIDAGRMLLPVLAQASNTIAVRRPLIAMLRTKPSWRLGYLQSMLQSSVEPIAVAEQLAKADLDPSNEHEAHILSDGLERLVAEHNYALASAILPQTREWIRNASFERPRSLLPFDWWLATESDLQAYPDLAAGGDGAYVLRIATNDRGGPVARQLVTLPVGRFVLRGLEGNSGGADTASPSLSITCADQSTPIAITQLNPPPAGTQRFAVTFTVPARDCTAQWITIETPAAGTVSAWIDALQLERIAA